MLISIVIPTLNEEVALNKLLPYLKADPSYPLVKEIIVVDAHSQDQTVTVVKKHGVTLLTSSTKGRAHQMNLGATRARGNILYFLHADTFPPAGFAQKIWDAYRNGKPAGCFRLRFDWNHWFLNANSWFTRFSSRLLRFGDQSLYVEREIFEKIEGFNPRLKLFEDQDLIRRILQNSSFKIIPQYVITSARKYRANGPFRLQLVYFVVYLSYALGFSQAALMRLYLRLVPYPRV